MTELIECVPNFSEGRDRQVIDAIVARIDDVAGVTVLDVDVGHSANRTVVSFVGRPAAVLEGAFAGIVEATRLIDMRRHQGVHWRQGSTDVCPFVPLAGATMQRCVELAHALGQRVASELDVPVYLYGEAALEAGRSELSHIRRGGYEGLEKRFREGRCLPDLGPARVDPRAGACAIGSRGLLVAYNVNLASRDASLARDIARRVRSRGFLLRDDGGRVLRDRSGRARREPGLSHCRANGWLIEEYGCAQVTVNLLDYRRTGLHDLYLRVGELARARGAEVDGSEIVGLVPRAALLAAGRRFAADSGTETDPADHALLDLAMRGLGLSRVRPFDPSKKILDERLEGLE